MRAASLAERGREKEAEGGEGKWALISISGMQRYRKQPDAGVLLHVETN